MVAKNFFGVSTLTGVDRYPYKRPSNSASLPFTIGSPYFTKLKLNQDKKFLKSPTSLDNEVP